MAFVIFTDLDGTLLDHASYSYAPARPALALLHTLDIPLILASSKTAAEIAPLRAELDFAHCPAIVENGAGLLPAHADPMSLAAGSSDYQRIRATLAACPEEFTGLFTGFGDWSVAQIATQTGLPMQAAVLAATRLFSEPGLFAGSAEQRKAFERFLSDHGIHARQGGRYYTLSYGATKADHMRSILAQIEKANPAAGVPLSIALGDAANDIEMLEAADYGIIITNPDGSDLPPLAGEAEGRIIRSSRPGPEGWNETVMDHISRLSQT